MKLALVAALALAVTAAQAQQTQDKGTQDKGAQDKGTQDRGYGQEKRAGEMHGQKGVKVSNPSEWQFHKVDEKHKGADTQATGNIQCAEPFGMKTGWVAKVAKFEAGSRFKSTAKEDMYIHIHQGSVSFSESETGAKTEGQERFGQDPARQPSDPARQPSDPARQPTEPERRLGQAQDSAGMKTAQAGALIFVPKGTTCWVSATTETMAVVFTKHEQPTGATESEDPKTDVK